MDPYQAPSSSSSSYGFVPQANGAVPMQQQHPNVHPFVPPPPPPMTSHQTASADGINAFFSSAPTQFIGQQFMQGGQQYVQRFQEKIGVFSGSILNYHFAINNEYVRRKLIILLTPYLKRWNFTRHPEQIPGGPRFRAPRADVNCPDMYIPLMAFCSYCVFGCLKDMTISEFSTDLMYTKVYRGLLGWLLHVCVFKILVYMMSMSSALSFVESGCYTGYMFVLLTLQLLNGTFQIKYLSVALWIYCSLSMGTFLVRSLKRLLYHEARHYGGVDMNRYNYLLLSLAGFQFVLFYFLS